MEIRVHHVGNQGRIIIGPADNRKIGGVTTDGVLWDGGEVKLDRIGSVFIPGLVSADSDEG